MKRYLVYFTELSDAHRVPCGQLSHSFMVHRDSLTIQEQIAAHIAKLRGGDGNKFFMVQSLCRTD